MAEYIERESLVEDIKQYCHARIDNDAIAKMGYEFVKGMGLIQRIIEKAPAADVAEVVRCKDCTFGKVDAEFDSVMCFCRNAPWDNKYVDYFVMSPLDYCSYGKKKEGAEE